MSVYNNNNSLLRKNCLILSYAASFFNAYHIFFYDNVSGEMCHTLIFGIKYN